MADWRTDQAAMAGPVQTENSDALEGESAQQYAGLLDGHAADNDFCGQQIIFMHEVGSFSQL